MSSRLLVAAGTTGTAAIDGISAAGAEPDALPHTPSADTELLVYGEPVYASSVPVSPTGCPTPALVTRAVQERLDLHPTIVDAGLASPTAAPTIDVGAQPGGDIRDPEPVPDARAIFESACDLGAALSDDHLVLAETIPGGTTTALGVLTGLDVAQCVSSSLPENPLDLKLDVVATALTSADFDETSAADALEVVRHVGDPVLPTLAGLTIGGLRRDAEVTLAGGTQLLAAAAIVRSLGHDDPLTIATTPYVAEDHTAAFRETAALLDLDVTVTDPDFDESSHPGLRRYVAGEGKEGVGMGGALAIAAEAGIDMQVVRRQAEAVYERVFEQ